MSDALPRAVEEAAAFVPCPETRALMRAMRKALADVGLENKAWGLPVIQWRDDARRIAEVNGEPRPPEEERERSKHLKV